MYLLTIYVKQTNTEYFCEKRSKLAPIPKYPYLLFVTKRESGEKYGHKKICSGNYCYSLQTTSTSNFHSEKAVRGNWGIFEDGTTRLVTNTFSRL